MKIRIDGIGLINVGDEFANLSPDDQNAFVGHVREQVGKGVKSAIPSQNVQPAAEPAKPENTIQDVARSLRGGLPFSDRIASAARSIPVLGNGRSYEENLADERAKVSDLAERHPLGNFVGNIVGGAALPIGVFGNIAKGAKTLGQIVSAGGKAGTGVGLLYGASSARDLTDPIDVSSNMIEGGASGALLGSVIPLAGAGIGRVAGYRSARNAPGADGMSRGATDILVDPFKTSGADALRGEAGRLGHEAMMADLDPSMTGLAQGAAIASDEGRKIVNEALKARSAGMASRISGTAREALGPAVPPRVADAGIRTARAKRDSVNYGNALWPEDITMEGPPPVDTSNVVRFVNNSIPRAEGDEKQFLEDFGKTLFKPNPDAVDRGPQKLLEMPKDKILGARDQAIAFGGIKDDRGDLRDLMAVYKGLDGRKRRGGGLTPDHMRESLAEQGYFDHIYGDPDRAMSESTLDDLFSILDENRLSARDIGTQAEIDAARAQRAKAKERASVEGETPSTVPKTEAENLHKIKTDLDKLLSGQPAFSFGPGRFGREDATISRARKTLNQALEQQVPGYERANRISEQYAKRGEALGIGQKALGSGPSAPWPQELRASIRPMSEKERTALKIGARGVIEERLGHQINDLRAGESLLKGENDFNRANAEMIFGKEPVDQLANRLAAERQFKGTENAVIGNSATASRQQALSKFKAIPLDMPPQTKTGMVTRAAAGILNRVLPDKTKYAGEVGGILTRQGSERDAAIEALAQWLIDQEARRSGGAQQGQSISRGLLAPLIPYLTGGAAGPSNEQRR